MSDTGSTGSKEALLRQVRDGSAVPSHVAIIMDGNGRWAAERGLPRFMGHREGMKAVRRAVIGALELDLGHLTLYAFSKENWSRPAQEVSALMKLLAEYVEREKRELAEKGVRVRVLGDTSLLSGAAMQAVESLQESTRAGESLTLNLCISYGSRDEILMAARQLARDCLVGEIEPGDITESAFSSRLYTAHAPDPDLLIRTSGEMRISNFLLWQIAYAEIHVTPVLWPDFGEGDLFRAVIEYQRRERRFGRVPG
jgi:undecaprenyl diphosphate synthase